MRYIFATGNRMFCERTESGRANEKETDGQIRTVKGRPGGQEIMRHYIV